jgi:hypothetical protein
MPVAGFLNPLQTLAPPLAMAAAAAAGGDAVSSGSLQGFVVPQQLQTEWCWAAVSCGVAAFYGPSQWTQCSIASAELAPLNCCGSDGPGACNQPWYLDRALTRVGHFDHMTAETSAFPGVQTEIGGRRPLGCRIAWAGGGAHFVALGGWSVAADGSSYVSVCDPFYGPVQKKYDDFVSAYMTSGDSWTHSYYTTGAMTVAGGGAPPNPNSPISA